MENLFFRNIEIGQVAHAAITIDFNYEEGEKGRFTPVVRNFIVNDLKSGKSKYALDVQGLAHAPVYNLRLEDCSFDNVAEPAIVKNVKDLTFHNVRINGKTIDSVLQVRAPKACESGSRIAALTAMPGCEVVALPR